MAVFRGVVVMASGREGAGRYGNRGGSFTRLGEGGAGVDGGFPPVESESNHSFPKRCGVMRSVVFATLSMSIK